MSAAGRSIVILALLTALGAAVGAVIDEVRVGAAMGFAIGVARLVAVGRGPNRCAVRPRRER